MCVLIVINGTRWEQESPPPLPSAWRNTQQQASRAWSASHFRTVCVFSPSLKPDSLLRSGLYKTSGRWCKALSARTGPSYSEHLGFCFPAPALVSNRRINSRTDAKPWTTNLFQHAHVNGAKQAVFLAVRFGVPGLLLMGVSCGGEVGLRWSIAIMPPNEARVSWYSWYLFLRKCFVLGFFLWLIQVWK